jgi:hypothetical protein
MRRVAAYVFAIGALVATTSSPAAAQTTPSLGGFQGSAAGSAMQVDYTPQGALPLPSLVDIGSPDALATISSGPTTYAQASVLDPGDLLANPDALLTLAVSGYPQGTLPAYPYRIAANSGFGEPAAASSPGPGLNASVRAEPAASVARASTPAVEAPPVANVGSMSVVATTKTDGSSVTVHSLTKVSGVDVFGLFTFDSVVTDLTAVAKGQRTTVSGGTKVVGAEVAGRPVTVDEKGVHGLSKSLNDALARSGISITVSGPTKSTSESAGRLASGGLRIDFDNSSRSIPALAALFDALPSLPNPLPPGPPTPDDLLVALQARHVAGLEFGRGVVSLATRGAAVFDEEIPFIPDLGSDVGGFDLPVLSDVPSLVPRQRVPVLGRSQNAGTTVGDLSPFGVGIGGMLLVALLLQPFLGQGLARLSNALLAPGAEHCDLEDL